MALRRPDQFGVWSTPRHWPRNPIVSREIKGRKVKFYNRCYATVDVKNGCTCRILERWPRDVFDTCLLCVETRLADTADEAREQLRLVRFFWAWHCRTRIAKPLRVLGADDRLLCA